MQEGITAQASQLMSLGLEGTLVSPRKLFPLAAFSGYLPQDLGTDARSLR